jgi:hypothetical protein
VLFAQAIEEGRHRNIENKPTPKCNMKEIETEYPFLLVCPYYNDLRKTYLPRLLMA